MFLLNAQANHFPGSIIVRLRIYKTRLRKKNNNLHVTYFKHVEKECLVLKNLLKYPKK